MIQKLILILLFSITNLALCQIGFLQSNDIMVMKNGEELENPWTGGMNFCQFSKIDLNLDGVEDLFVFDKSGKNGTKNGNKIIPFLFNTTDNSYTYAPEYVNSFPDLKDWVLLIDYNMDSKIDIFSSYNSSIALYTNTSDQTLSFEFTKVITSDAGFGAINLYVSNSDLPAIVDVDGDLDIDILTFDPSGSHVYFHENKSMQLYGNCDSMQMVRSDDCWGRFREDFSTNSVTLNLDEDCNAINEDGRSARHSGSTLLALDLNPQDNGGLELLLGDITYNNMVMLFNGGNNNEAWMIDQDLNFPNYSEAIDLTRFPGAFYLDVDNDNLKDLIISPNGVNVSENHNNSFFYKNTGSNNDGYTQFTFNNNDFLIKDMIDVGSNAMPILFDLNEDELLDLIIANKGYFNSGNYDSSITLYKNTGTLENPIFEFVTQDFSNLLSLLGSLTSIQSIHPTFGDLNGDGNIDMIIGDNNGELYYFENNGEIQDGGTGSEWPFYSSYQMLDIDVGSFATPQLIDLNRDGLLDLIIGERMGIDNGVYNGINYYQNIGSETNPQFENYTPDILSGEYDENGDEIITRSLGGIHIADPTYLTSYTVPQIFEYNNTYYLAVGCENGLIYLYDNVEYVIDEDMDPLLNLNTEFNLITENLVDNNNCIHAKATVSDINNDQLPDVLRGNASGGVELFLAQNFNTHTPVFDNQKIKVFPNPNNGFFNIKLPNIESGYLKIYSNLGKLIISKEITNKTENVLISNIKSGLYILEIHDKNILFNEKIIINSPLN